ncbi:unnamed protein product [Nyctereutes procyonoides]|uniref:(raccoon dog) hypothetical protein n=1 Tax=Nyctereutes procyonoides TaxID=34880 RepID=A0A811YZN6_NYCPR|nr:unnamed protein product [Nyctereutes procyonoides]
MNTGQPGWLSGLAPSSAQGVILETPCFSLHLCLCLCVIMLCLLPSKLDFQVPFIEIMWGKKRDTLIEWEENSKAKALPPFVIQLDITSDNIKFILYMIESLPYPTLNCTLTVEDLTVHCRILESYNSHIDLIKYSWNCSSALCKIALIHLKCILRRKVILQEIQRHSFKITSGIVLVGIVYVFLLLIKETVGWGRGRKRERERERERSRLPSCT